MERSYDLAVLKQKFKGKITTEEADLEKYSRDASIFEIHPQVVVTPMDSEDIKALVHFAANAKPHSPEISLTVRAGGTDMTGGSINDSIIIDVAEHLNKITNLSDKSVETEAGVKFADLEPKLIAKNVIMPAYPVSKAWAAVGGMVGNNCGGEKTFKYGQAANYVSELTVILADGNEYIIKPLTEPELQQKMSQKDFEGELYRKTFQLIQDNYRAIQEAKPTTSKNASGYYLWDVWDGTTFDLTKLFVGSQGTLGIITNIKWRLVPLERGRQLVVFYLHDLKLLGQIINHVNDLSPESFEIFDDQTFKLAVKFWPEMIGRMKGSKWQLFKQFLPDIWLWAKGDLPKLVLLAEFTGGTQEEAQRKATEAAHNIEQHFNLRARLSANYEESQKYWGIRRESYNLLRKHNARKISAPFVEDIIVHPEQLPNFIPQLDAIMAKYPDFISTLAGHAGDANFHIIPLVDISIPNHRKQLVWMSNEVFDLVLKYKGSMTAEHNDGLVRGPFLEHMFGEKVYGLFKQIKQIYDPLNIFNPHKKTDADMKYYTDHVRVHN